MECGLSGSPEKRRKRKRPRYCGAFFVLAIFYTSTAQGSGGHPSGEAKYQHCDQCRRCNTH
jgi:hypothetical protein